MAKPEKEKVSSASAVHADPSAGSNPPSCEPGAKTPAAADPDGSAAVPTSDAAAEAVEAEVETETEAEVLDPAEGASADDAAKELAKAKAEAEEWQDKYVRLHAEWDTYRRRMNEQREAEKARATEKLVTSLIPVIDDFERTIDYAQKNGESGLLGGVEAVHAKFIDVLTKDGVAVIDPKGEAFDALEAQAVATVDDASVPDETVADVYQKGYKMGKKVLRPAMVTVTSGGPKRPKKEPGDE